MFNHLFQSSTSGLSTVKSTLTNKVKSAVELTTYIGDELAAQDYPDEFTELNVNQETTVCANVYDANSTKYTFQTHNCGTFHSASLIY